MPAFGVKQDAIPGFVRDTWFTRRQGRASTAASAPSCAAKNTASCRSSSGEVESTDYAKWVGEQKAEAARLPPTIRNKQWELKGFGRARRKSVRRELRRACRQANGKGVPGAFPALDGSECRHRTEGTRRSPSTLRGVMKDGKPAAMVAWNQLSDTDLAAVITYTHAIAGATARAMALQPSRNQSWRENDADVQEQDARGMTITGGDAENHQRASRRENGRVAA